MAVTAVEPTINISSSELVGSPTEQMRDGVFTATVRRMCAWGDRLTLMEQLLGKVVPVGDGSDLLLVKSHAYPHYKRARAKTVDIKPWFPADIDADATEGNEWASHVDAELTITYDTSFDEDNAAGGTQDDTALLMTEDIEVAAEFLTLPKAGMKWTDANGDALEDIEAPAKYAPALVWTVTRHRVPIIPTPVITGAGKINSLAVTSLTFNHEFPAKTLLYEPGRISRQYDAFGAQQWEVALRFSYRESTWEKFWNKDKGAWDVIYDENKDGGAGNLEPYESFDFLTLGI